MLPGSTPIAYRYDINGLRAWAVVAVLLFHFGLPGASAGFIGVDIFFVISGYLMTAIIVNSIEAGSFSIWRFYLARIRRIAPALMALIAVLLALGWFWLPTADYKELGTQSASALGFISNILFWRSAGYFDASAHEKWLLHTWSLGIEFQFYILFPIYVLLLWKARPKTSTITWGLVISFFLSLSLSVIFSSIRPAASFYLLPTRGWELAAGGLVFLAGRNLNVQNHTRGYIFWIGVTLSLLGFILIDDTLAWPAGWALLPVLGTSFIIFAQRNSSQLIRNPILQWLGDRSYSIYLWHWPLVVTLYFLGLQENWLWIASGLMVSLILGHISYSFIENTTRTSLIRLSSLKQVGTLASGAFAIGLMAFIIKQYNFEDRIPKAVEIAAAEKLNRDPRRSECFSFNKKDGSPNCIYGAPEKIGAILMGDSHAASVITSVGKAAEAYNKGVRFWGMDSCPTLENVKYTARIKRPKKICSDLNTWAFKELENYKNVPIILVSRTSSYLMGPNEPDRVNEAPHPSIYFDKEYEYRSDPGFAKEFLGALVTTACNLAKDREVYLMRPVPEFGTSIYQTLIRQHILSGDSGDVTLRRAEYDQRNKLVWEAQNKAADECGVKILNPLQHVCDEGYCYGSKNGRPLYYDDDHLSEYGNKFLVPMFEKVFH